VILRKGQHWVWLTRFVKPGEVKPLENHRFGTSSEQMTITQSILVRNR